MLYRPRGPHVQINLVFALIAAGAAVAPAAAGAGPDPHRDLQVVTESPYYFEAVVDVPRPTLVPSKLGAAEAVRLELPGWISGSPEGTPLLPMRSLAVAVPEGENVRISVQGEGPAVFRDVLLVPFSQDLFEQPGLDAFPAEAASDRAYSANALLPESLYEMRPACYLRDLRLVPIDVCPARYNPVSRELQVYDKLRIRVETEAGAAGAVPGAVTARIGADARIWDEVYRAAAINYPSEMAYRAMRRRAAVRRFAAGDYFNGSQHWLAVDVSQRGIYNISYEDMLGAGVTAADLGDMDPSTLRLFNGGGLGLDANVSVLDSPSWMSECALLVQDGGDGSFGPGDRLIFYAQGTEGWSDHFTGASSWGEYQQNLHTGTNVYWLTWNGSFSSGAPLRMSSRNGAPDGSAAYVAGTYKERVHVERNLEWDPTLRTKGIRWERWWWQLLKMGDGRVYTVNLSNVVTGAPCRLKARFWGEAYTLNGCLVHHVMTLSFNDSDQFMRSTFLNTRMDFDTTAVWAVDGANKLVARIPSFVDSCLLRNGKSRTDESYLAWFELEYYRELVARNGELAFDWTEGTSGPVRFVARGFGASGAFVFDVTDRFEPALVTGAAVSADTVAFQEELDGSRRNYYVVSESALRSPDGMRIRSPGALRAGSQPVDYIIVTGDGLMEAAQVLADWRTGHLYGITDGGGAAYAEVVDVRDIYDEFSWGLVDPVAIKNFLEYRFKSAPAGERPPSYALMFGDATWDFRDYSNYGVTNIVPSYDDGFDRLTASQFSSDDFFCLFEGPGDPYEPPGDEELDMAVGRLSPETPAEAMDLVTEKIIGFEQGAEAGPWRCRILLAADDACKAGPLPEGAGEQHTEQADDLYKRRMPRAFDFTKIYLIEYGSPGCVESSKPTARADFARALSSGAAVVNYVGHGSAPVLAQEGLFYADDVATLENRGRLGLFITASCAVGVFDEPLEIGLAEGLVRSPSRGALAAYGATTLAYVTANKELNAWLAEAVLPRAAPGDSVNLGQGTTLGLAVAQAEARYSNWFYIAPYEYQLLGDPASVLALPGTPYPSGGSFLGVDLDLSQGVLAGGERDTLRGEIVEGGSLASWFDGTVDLLVEGAQVVKPLGEGYEPYIKAGPTFYHGRAAVSGGRFEISWVNPYELVTGSGGRVRAFAWNDERDALGAVANIQVAGPTGPKTDTEGPDVEVSFEGGATTVSPGAVLSIKVSDPGGINLAPLLAENALFVRLYNEELGQLVDGPVELSAGFTYEEGSSSSGSASYALPGDLSTEEGANAYRVEVNASDNFSNRSTVELSFKVVASSALKLTDVINYPNPFSTSTTFGFRVLKEADVVLKIFTVGGRRVRTLRAPAVSGWGQLVWDGTDTAGDPVSNGVYIYKVTASSTANHAEKADFIGKAVVLR